MASFTKGSLPYLINNNFIDQLKTLGFKVALIHSTPQIQDIYNVDYYRDLGFVKHGYLQRAKHLATFLLWGEYWENEKAQALHEEALKIIEQCKDPLFLIIWYMDVHQPYHPSNLKFQDRLKTFLLTIKMYEGMHTRQYEHITETDLQNLIKYYDQQIVELDNEIGNFLDKLENPFVVLTADHGEEFLEHGKLSHHGDNIPALLHVPLIISSPNIKPKVIEEQTTLDQLHNLILRNIRDHLLNPIEAIT